MSFDAFFCLLINDDTSMMKMNLRKILLAGAVVVTMSAFAPVKEQFTAAEQQQISIATPDLFKRSSTFNIDFTALKDVDYSFPLPVGKAKILNNRYLEIETSKGDVVKAMFDGVVRLSRKHPEFGNVVVVRHSNGLETVYANNAQNLAKVGQIIQAGQAVAIVGNKDGRSVCNFAVMVNGGRINPGIMVDPGCHKLRQQIIQCKKVGSHVDVAVVTEGQKKTSTDSENPFANGNTFKLNLADVQSGGHWAFPLPGAKVISPYGGRRGHDGVDLKTRPNDKIVAAFDGVVTQSGPHYGYGNCITIKHKYGVETLYGHQSKNLVKVGKKVKAGDVIGLTGRTGRATTEHLHFEIKYKGRQLNPAMVFNCEKRKLQNATFNLTKSGRITSKRNN